MREPIFVKQNAKKWERFEASQAKDPDELADSFIQITDDLAYAKTFYPKSKTTAYLNGLAGRFHQSIYKNKTESGNRFITFWKFELPMLFYTHRKPLLYAFSFFMVFCLIGWLSARYDENFVRLILSDAYVDKTNANIVKGEPFGIYDSMSEFKMFFYIAVNNIYVSLVTFVFGIIFSVGTIYQLFQNGLMLGAFQYYFFSKGLGMQSVLVIWIHGTLEISAIVIAGGAGLVLGNSFLFPKTYSRIVSLKKGAADSMKIVLGLIPIFITAAFLEGFVTRHTKMPIWLSVGILASSLTFIIWYVVIYPRKIYNKTQYGA
jgi:uncharacterized membrane protein SpoIIM required for sporulation